LKGETTAYIWQKLLEAYPSLKLPRIGSMGVAHWEAKLIMLIV